MPDKRYSVMVLPKLKDKLLLQSFEKDGDTTWDGFGSFYDGDDDPKETAQKVFEDSFADKIGDNRLVERAKLKYFIHKSTGLVELDITVYFAFPVDASLKRENSEWFDTANIPYSQMHPATGRWLPLLLKDTALLKAVISIEQPGDHTKGIVTEFTQE